MKTLSLIVCVLVCAMVGGCASTQQQAAALEQQQAAQASAAHAFVSDVTQKVNAAHKYLATTQPTAGDIATARNVLAALSVVNGPLAMLDATISNMEATGQKQADLAVAADNALARERAEFWSYRQRRGFVWLCVIAAVVLIGVILLRVASSPVASAALGPAWTGVVNFLGHLLTGFIAIIYKLGEKLVVWLAKLFGRAAVAVGTKAAPLVAKMAPASAPPAALQSVPSP